MTFKQLTEDFYIYQGLYIPHRKRIADIFAYEVRDRSSITSFVYELGNCITDDEFKSWDIGLGEFFEDVEYLFNKYQEFLKAKRGSR